ncbi:MAG: dihydrofolate reductase family protein [Microlunatus sp.]
MSKVILYMSMSVDGFIAAPGDEMGHGLGVGGEPLHAWLADGGISPGSYRPTSRVNAGLINEMVIHLVPLLLGQGRRLFDDPGAEMREVLLVSSRVGDGALHLRYRVLD